MSSGSQAPRERPEGPPGPLSSFLEEVIGAKTAGQPAAGRTGHLDRFLAEKSFAAAISLWVGPESLRGLKSRDALARLIGRDIARLDGLISAQVDAILHQPRFQKLEASWRGLAYLIDQAGAGEEIKIKLLDVSWKDLVRDAERAVEFDQSQLFRKVYTEEFDMPGGEPFGVLLGDYDIHLAPGPDHPSDDLAALASVTRVAAAAFAPFITAAHPSLFGLESFTQLERPINLKRIFDQPEYLRWRELRESEDSRFLGLVLPRILLRLPHGDDRLRPERFRYVERVDRPDRGQYLWGNACYAFGATVLRAFSLSGWLADIRGVQRDVDGGGLVTGLPVDSFTTDRSGVAPKYSTEVALGDSEEKELSDLGFIPLCHLKDTDHCAFYSNQSIQKPKAYTELAATMNAKISAMLQYMLCVSRFAHYIKVRGRQKVGSFTEAQVMEDDLNRWISDYVAPDPGASAADKARFPLREAQVQIAERPGKPGVYQCVMHLLPHYQLDALSATVTLKTEMGGGPTT